MFNSQYTYDLKKIGDGRNYVIICENTLKNKLKLKIIIDTLRGMSFLGRGIWKNNHEQIAIWVYPNKFIYLKDNKDKIANISGFIMSKTKSGGLLNKLASGVNERVTDAVGQQEESLDSIAQRVVASELDNA